MILTRPTAPLNPPGHKQGRWRSGITPFVAVVGVLMLLLMLGNAIALLLKYKYNYDNAVANVLNLDNATSSNKVSSQLAGTVEFAMVTNELATTINAHEQQQLYEINAATKLAADTIATLHQNNNNNSNLLAALAVTHLKSFDDEINIHNQRYELNDHPADEPPKMPAAAVVALTTANESGATAFSSLTAVRREEGVFGQYTPLQQQEKQLGRGNHANTELLLHRQKRYLVFPEGSSFQMVFDLIIGMVDYTSYLILGITCAVAWELPSKPPSELIEELHDKVTEGIYPPSEAKPATEATAMRRNDSTVVGDGMAISKYGVDAESIKYVDNSNVPAYYDNLLQRPIGTAGLRQPPQTHELPPFNAFEAAHQTKLFPVPATSYSGYHKETPGTRGGIANGAYRPINYYANIQSDYKNSNGNNKYYNPTHKYSFADKIAKSSYYGVSDSYNKNPFGNTAEGDSTDKLPVNAANRWQQHQQPQYKKWQSWQDYDSNWQSYQQPQQKHAKWAQQQQQWQQQQQKWSTQSKNVPKDNWWSRNKQQVTDSWRVKQADGLANRVRMPSAPIPTRPPVLTYAPPSTDPKQSEATFSSNAETLEGRSFDGAQRHLLTTHPKARVYPVFGRRRRRRRSVAAELDDFEHKLERIHLREQLRTRQKLYGKIEKLYETRGMNGSACVLRALCETGQQQQSYEEGKAEPQSFITELLRAIFVLPTTGASAGVGAGTVNFEEPALHPTDLHIIDRPYREAPAHRGSCSQLFAMCEHSIWE
ncbi:uncharacterized protein LOC126751238 [Bactrocera neohumeralis]|uniref:uncharacterized protein LOC126751238 n=1 Tax=Bactrocera neohumeralis TaxID=98809 RepID=UPI0021657EB7|nr:uncharacterized protein LOC126751238 [Bactrocera neohumeralis]